MSDIADSQENTTRNLESMEQRQQLSVAQVSVAEVQVTVAKSTKNHRLRDGMSGGAGVQIVLHSNDIRRLCFLWQKTTFRKSIKIRKTQTSSAVVYAIKHYCHIVRVQGECYVFQATVTSLHVHSTQFEV